jgi:hypothetical protein
LINTLIGYVYQDGVAGDLVTVFTRGFAMIYALANATSAGPASYSAYDTTNAVDNNNQQSGAMGYSRYLAEATPAEQNAWVLDLTAAGLGKLTRVLLMH